MDISFWGATTEWFSDESKEEPTPLVNSANRAWRGNEEVCVPDSDVRETDANVVFLDCDANRNLIEYRRFGSWQRSDTVLYFTAEAQEVLKHEKLLGVYFGYIFELNGNRLWNTGHLDYERVF